MLAPLLFLGAFMALITAPGLIAKYCTKAGRTGKIETGTRESECDNG